MKCVICNKETAGRRQVCSDACDRIRQNRWNRKSVRCSFFAKEQLTMLMHAYAARQDMNQKFAEIYESVAKKLWGT